MGDWSRVHWSHTCIQYPDTPSLHQIFHLVKSCPFSGGGDGIGIQIFKISELPRILGWIWWIRVRRGFQRKMRIWPGQRFLRKQWKLVQNHLRVCDLHIQQLSWWLQWSKQKKCTDKRDYSGLDFFKSNLSPHYSQWKSRYMRICGWKVRAGGVGWQAF